MYNKIMEIEGQLYKEIAERYNRNNGTWKNNSKDKSDFQKLFGKNSYNRQIIKSAFKKMAEARGKNFDIEYIQSGKEDVLKNFVGLVNKRAAEIIEQVNAGVDSVADKSKSNNDENDIPNHDSENSSQQDPEENKNFAENLQSNQNGFEPNDIVQGFMQKVIDAYDNADGKPDEFKTSMQNIFDTEVFKNNLRTINAGFRAIKSTCGNKFDAKKMKDLEDTSDSWNEFKALIALIYNYTIGLIAGQYDRTTKQDKNDYKNFVLLETNRQNLEEYNKTKGVLNL